MSLGVTVTNEEAIVRHTKRTNYWIQLGKQCRKGKKKRDSTCQVQDLLFEFDARARKLS